MFENTPPTNPMNDGLGSAPVPPPMPGVPGAPPLSPAPPGPGEGQDLHTMPDRFFAGEAGGGEAGGGHGRGRMWKVLLIILAALVVIGAGSYFAFTRFWGDVTNSANQAFTNLVNSLGNAQSNGNRNVNANGNGNVNLVVNINAPANTNANLNGNTNAANANMNANTNANANANTNTSPSTTPLPSSTDTDGDGLTDVEETLYGTSAAAPDTDGDGFVDGKQLGSNGQYAGEVYLGYDPTKAATRLTDNSALVTPYSNDAYRYKVYYPTKWTARASDGGRAFLMSSDGTTGEYFQVTVADNPQQLSAAQWFASLNLTGGTAITVNGLDGIRHPALSTVYLVKADKAYILTYSTGTLTTANYWTTFDVLINTFALVAASGGTVTTPTGGSGY